MGPAAAAARPSIAKASFSCLPAGLSTLWWAASSVPHDAAVMDARHLVLAFRVNFASPPTVTGVPARLTKYSDREDHALYRAECLKLATLRHYRERHQDLEGVWDPMEGRSRIASTLDEMCRRRGARTAPRGAHLVATAATYKTEDTNLVFCTSRPSFGAARPDRWKFASRIRDVSKFALLLGAEFARQFDMGRRTAVTGLDRLVAAAVQSSGLASAVHFITDPSFTTTTRARHCLRVYPNMRGALLHISSSARTISVSRSTASSCPLKAVDP